MPQTEAEAKAEGYDEKGNIADYQLSLRDVAVHHDSCCWTFPDGSTLEFFMNDGGLDVKTHLPGSKEK